MAPKQLAVNYSFLACLYHTTLHLIHKMIISARFISFFSFVAFATADGRRGVWTAQGHSTAFFSAGEQALLGSCSSEDCMFGASTSSFRIPADDKELTNKPTAVRQASVEKGEPGDSNKKPAFLHAQPSVAFIP